MLEMHYSIHESFLGPYIPVASIDMVMAVVSQPTGEHMFQFIRKAAML